MGEGITQPQRQVPGLRPLEYRTAETMAGAGPIPTEALPALSPEALDRLVHRVSVEAVVQRERAKDKGNLADYLQASRVLNLTEHRLEPEQFKSLAALEDAAPAKLFEKLRRSEAAEQAEVTLIENLRDRLAAGESQGKDELRFTIERTTAPLSEKPSYMLMLSLPEGRDPRDWVAGHSAGRRLDRNTRAVVLTVRSPEMRRSCEAMLRELPSGVGSIGYSQLHQLLTFGPAARVTTRAQDSFDAAVSTDPAGAVLQTALLRHPTENRIHLLPKTVLWGSQLNAPPRLYSPESPIRV